MPKLSILTSHGGAQPQETCLAAGFYPKDGTLSLSLKGKDAPVDHATDNAILSNTGVYYYAAFSREKITTCKMGNEATSEHNGNCKYPY